MTLPNALSSVLVLALATSAFAQSPGVRLDAKLDARAAEAIKRIESVGGAVRQITDPAGTLEVDFQFADDQFRDELVEQTAALPNVAVLRLNRTSLTDAGLAHVTKLSSLQRLYLDHTAITDRGLVHLAALPDLEFVNLYATAVSDAGLAHFQKLARLKTLHVGATKVTAAGIAFLRQAVPQLVVTPDPLAERRRSTAFVEVARRLLADADADLARAELGLKDLSPREDELKKDEASTRKRSEELRGQADQLRKQRDDAQHRSADSERAANEARKKAESKPNDEKLAAASAQRQKDAAEAKQQFDALQEQFAQTQTAADEAKAKAVETLRILDRSRNAKKYIEEARKVHDGAQQRMVEAERLFAATNP